jgi:hypothetical protein
MFNRGPSLPSVLAAILCAAIVPLSGCKKKSSDSAASDNAAPIVGKPTDAPVAIKPAWKSGNKYLMRLERTQVGRFGPVAARTRRGQGQNSDAPVETTYAQEYTVTITNGAAGNRGAELEITGIELVAARGEETFINYDSQNKAAPRDQSNPISTAVVNALDRLIGGKVYYLLGSDGKVQKVEGVNDLFARADGTNAPRGPFAASTILRRAISEDTFKQMVEINGAPGQDMKIGDSWPFAREVDAGMAGKIAVSVTNTLRGWQERDGTKCARVEFTGTVSSAGNAEATPGRISISDGQVTGHYWYDPAIGLNRELEMKQSFNVSGALGGNRNTNNATPVSIPVKESLSVKLLEVKPAA